MLTNSGDQVRIQTGKEVTFVADYEKTPVAGVLDPVIDSVLEGLDIEANAIVHPNLRHVTLETRIKVTNVRRPLPEKTIEIDGKEVTIQLPTSETRAVEWAVSLG